MLTFPFRLLATIFVMLFLSSRFIRRAVAGVAVSAVIVAAQHEELFRAATGSTDHQAPLATLKALLGLISG